MDTNQPFRSSQAEIFNALAHPARLEILSLLRRGEACVCHIQAGLNYRQAYISQHLNVLRQAGLVKRRKSGQFWYYQLTDPAVLEILDLSVKMLGQVRNDPHLAEPIISMDKITSICRCPECCPDQSLISLEGNYHE